MQIKQIGLYKLGPVDLMIFNVIALASVQKSVRSIRHFDAATDDIAPTNEANGTISRRRIADVTGLPRSNVARALKRLMDRDMVVERSRGHVQVPVGLVLQDQFACDFKELYAPVVTMMEQFMKLDIVRQREPIISPTTT